MPDFALETAAKRYLKGFGVAVSDEERVTSCRTETNGDESSIVLETEKYVYTMPVDSVEVIIRRK